MKMNMKTTEKQLDWKIIIWLGPKKYKQIENIRKQEM